MKRFIFLILLGFCGWHSLHGATAPAELRTFRYGYYDSYVRLVFEFSSPATYQYTPIDASSRQRIVLPYVRLASGIQNHLTFRDPILSALDFTTTSSGGVSMQFQGREPIRIEVLKLDNATKFACDVFLQGSPPAVSRHLPSPRDANSYYEAGLELELQKNYEGALAQYRKAIRLQRGYPEAYYHAGISRLMLHDLEKARINFRQVPASHRLYPKAQEYLSGLAYDVKSMEPDVSTPLPSAEDAPSQSSEQRSTPAQHGTADEGVFSDEQDTQSMLSTAPEQVTLLPQQDVSAAPAAINDDRAQTIEEVVARDRRYLEQLQKATTKDASKTSAESSPEKSSATTDITSFITHRWYLYIGGGLAAVFAVFIGYLPFLLKRKIRKKPKAAKQNFQKMTKVMQKALAKEVQTGRMRARPNAGKNPQFTRQLLQMYSQTDPAKSRQSSGRRTVRSSEQAFHAESEKRSREIDAMLDMPEGETVKMAKTFRRISQKETSSPDYYEAVYYLYDQDWEPWKIARELKMGIDEVKMALEVRSSGGTNGRSVSRLRRIHQLRKANKSVSEIAKNLGVGTGAVELAIQLGKDK